MNIRAFLITLFWKQNQWHKYSVLRHTFSVVYSCVKLKQYNLIIPALLHDIGKPFVAFQDEDDIIENIGSYSFTNHEEKSYQIIKNWKLISEETKLLVRYHYLITGMLVSLRKFLKTKDVKHLDDYTSRKLIWNNLNYIMQDKLMYLKFSDDEGKGYPNLTKAIPKSLEKRYAKLVKSNS
jgi:hypothetical protein